MAEIVDQISDVETKQLPTGIMLYLVKDSKGKEYSTRDRALAQQAYKAMNEYVLFDYTEKKNERGFTNRYLNHLAPVEPPKGDGGGLGEGPPAGLFDDSAPEPVQTSKDEQIARAVALKAAADIVGLLPEDQRTPNSIIGMADFFLPWLLGRES
jgi:hypothetical protein